jgi:high-affinity Fe2+/Pb2+ permease
MHPEDLKVPVGFTTVAGLASAVAGAIVVFLSILIEMDNDQIVAVTGALTTLISVGLVLWGRYAQSKQLAEGVAARQVVASAQHEAVGPNVVR